MRVRSIHGLGIGLILLAVGGLVRAQNAATPPPAAAGSAPSSQPSAPNPPPTLPDYTLQASDLIEVQVFQEDDLTRDVRLSQEYTVTLPLIGTVNLKGKTVRQAGELIRDLYNNDYLVNPQVSIIVKDYAARTVNVLGAVTNAGAVSFPPEQPMNLLDAIAKAGGFTRLADRTKVKLTRALPDGSVEAHIINTDDIIQGRTKETWPLQKDDVIYVPERLF